MTGWIPLIILFALMAWIVASVKIDNWRNSTRESER